MKLNIKLLEEICRVPGAPGFENPIRKVVLREVKKLADKVTIDGMGNVIALKKGKKSSKKLMTMAHMDEIGFIVTHIDDKGFIRFTTLGGFDPKTLTAQRVIVHGKKDIIGVMGGKPIHLMTAEERGKNVKIEDYFIDTGLPKSEVEKIVSIGDSITRRSELLELGECINCKSLDNRVSVFILIETLKKLKNPAYDFYAVFTVQEEVGLRGAIVAGHKINPDFVINLDTTIAFDTPEAKPQEMVSKLGEGTAIKIMDSSVICDRRMVAYMKDVAKKKKIKWQPEILPRGGTDTAGAQRMAMDGAICGAISIPTRFIHQSIEMCHKLDISTSIDLLKACAEGIDKGKWTW